MKNGMDGCMIQLCKNRILRLTATAKLIPTSRWVTGNDSALYRNGTGPKGQRQSSWLEQGRRGYEAGRAGELVFDSGSLRLTLAWRVKGNEEKAPHDDHYGVSAVC